MSLIGLCLGGIPRLASRVFRCFSLKKSNQNCPLNFGCRATPKAPLSEAPKAEAGRKKVDTAEAKSSFPTKVTFTRLVTPFACGTVMCTRTFCTTFNTVFKIVILLFGCEIFGANIGCDCHIDGIQKNI